MSEGARRRSNAVDRRPLRFWEPFNIWWRAELERTGKRATSDDIARWYAAQSGHAWGPEKPSLQETRTHAKCLRSVSSVRDYFREYRAKKKHEQSEMDMDEEDEDDRRSRSTARRGSRSRAARSNSTAAYSDMSGAMQSYMAYSNEQGYWGSGLPSAYLDGAMSGMTTAAGAAAGADSQAAVAAAAQAMAEYGQHMPSFDMACVHPGALDASWAGYTQGPAAAMTTPVTTQGPIVPTPPGLQQAAQYENSQQQKHSDAGGAGVSIKQEQTASWQQAAGAGLHVSSQHQSQQQEPQGVVPVQIPPAGAAPAAGRVSMNLLSPGLHQLAGSLALQMEMPSISPRVKQAAALAEQPDAGNSAFMLQQGSALPSVAVKTEAGSAQAQQQPAPVPLWNVAAQQYSQQQYDAHAAQGYMLSAAAGFGSFASQQDAMQQAQQQGIFGQPAGSWFQEALRRQSASAAGLEAPTAAHNAFRSPARLGGLADAQPEADAPASAPQGTHASQERRAADAPSAAPAAAEEAQPAMADAADTPHGVIPASLLAAVPLPAVLPGCPGHSTVDSILRQLEAGARTPRGGRPGAPAALASEGHPFARMSLSAMLDAPGLLPHGVTAARQLSQSFEHLPLQQQRLSLYAMGSGMLDMLSEGLDLDAFLGASDLGGVAPGGAGGDAIAPIAPGSRASLRWLRTSCHMQVPEHWQQHLQTLQEAPFRGHMGAPAGGLPPAQAPLRMGRASSAGIDALAEAAAAALAARPDLLQDRSTATTSAQQGEGAGHAEQNAVAGDDSGAARPTPHKKRAREQQSTKVEMGPPASGYKRPCASAGLGLNLTADHQDADGGKPQGHKFVLDLATPRPEPAQQQVKEQPAPQQQPQPQQESRGDQKQALLLTDEQGEQAAQSADAAEPDLQQDNTPQQKRPVVLDLRPEELGATSENTIVSPQHGTAQATAAPTAQGTPARAQEGHGQAKATQPAGSTQVQQGLPKKLDGLMLPPLQSPVAGAAGINTRGTCCGPATAASTTGAPPVGPDGAVLPAPAMAHVAMAAAMAAAVAVRPHVQASVAAAAAAAPRRPPDPAKRLLPAMDEIERMI